MQQTQKYKLNLIESSDPFLPDALNANTQKIEDVLIDKMEGPLDAMDQRVTALEAHRFFVGTYIGTGKDSFVNLNATPLAVFVLGGAVLFSVIASGEGLGLQITEGGFIAGHTSFNSASSAGTTYLFLAFI